jgi:poly(3-hydroxybutyrate) depolymerase
MSWLSWVLERRAVYWGRNEVHELATMGEPRPNSLRARGPARAAPTNHGLERSGRKLIGVLGLLLALPIACSTSLSEAATKSAGCGSAGRATGNFHLKTTDGRGAQRDYEVIVPTSYNPSVPLALSFVFHGAGGTQADAKGYGLQSVAGAGAASIFVFPQGVAYQQAGVGWDDSCQGYDVALFDKISATLQATYCIDTERVFVAGFSWGCDFATALACCRGDKIRAVAAASCSDDFRTASDPASYRQAPCPVTNKAAIRFTHATTGDFGYPAPLFATTSKLFQSFNRCSAESVAGSQASCRSFRNCRSPFVECSYDGLGHALPSTWAADTWAFFKSVSAPPAATPAPAMPRSASIALTVALVGGGVVMARRRRRPAAPSD